MAFDQGFFTMAPNGKVFPGISFGGADRGAQYIGPHLVFDPGQIMADEQRTLRTADGKFSYFATFHNLQNTFSSFRITGGGFV